MEKVWDVLRHLVSYGHARNAEEEQQLLAVIDDAAGKDPQPVPEPGPEPAGKENPI